MHKTVHIIDDDTDFADSLSDVLSSRDYDVITHYDGRSGVSGIDPHAPSVCLLDLRIGAENGIDLLEQVTECLPETLSIILTAYADTETAIQALKRGAYDYLRKPLDMELLFAALDRSFDTIQLRAEKREAQERLEARNQELAVLNERLRDMVEAAQKLAACRTPNELDEKLLDEFAKNMAARGGSLYIKERNELVLIHSIGPKHAAPRIPLPPPVGSHIAHVFEKKEPVLLTDEASRDLPYSSGWSGYDDESSLCFPMLDIEGDVIGVVNLHNKTWPPFSSQDLDLGRILISLTSEVMRSLDSLERLARRERHFRELFENSPAVNLLIDGDGLVVDTNQATGVSKESLVGRHFCDLVNADETDDIVGMFEAIKRGDAVKPAEVSVEIEEGTNRIYYLPGGHYSALYEGDELLGYIIAGIDITELKIAQREARESEAQLYQASKLASLGTLTAGIAHEINNPNNYIRLNVQNLAEFWREARPIIESHDVGHQSFMGLPLRNVLSMVGDMLESLEEGSIRIEKLVRSLREYARHDTGELNDEVDLNSVIETAMQIMESTIRSATSHFDLDLCERLPTFHGSFHRIEQVIMNVLSNACHALRGRDEGLRVRTGCTSSLVWVEVRDDGCGIDPDLLDRITDPFFTTKRDRGGTGLGLSVSARIIEDHGGRMKFSSRVSKGTTVRIEFPIHRDG